MMFTNLKLAWRNLRQHKLFSVINIGGLGLGLAVSMLILLYVSHELSFDRFHANSGRIFSTLMKLKMGENDIRMNLFAPDFAERVKIANPEVSESVRLASDFRSSPTVKSTEGRQFIEKRFYFADPSVFRIFSFHLLEGDANTALQAPDAVVISSEMAKKYFGESSPVGQTLLYDKQERLMVTGVFEKMPLNSSLQFDFIGSLNAYERILRREQPDRNFDLAPNFQTWFLLDKPESAAKVEASIPAILPKIDDPILSAAQYDLSPLTEMHLGNNWSDFSNSKYISIFTAVSVLVLFLALFNYMNLTTARAAARAREVGVRKVLGAQPGQLRSQFYGESVLVSALGYMAGLGLFAMLKPFFCTLLDLKIDDSFVFSPMFIGILAGLFLVSALIAGSYPALLLSRFSPLQIIRGGQSGSTGAGVRKGLTVFQFTVSTALIVFSLGIGAQLKYLQQRPIGLNREQVLAVKVTPAIASHFSAAKQALRQVPGVEQVSAGSFALFQGGWDMLFLQTPTTHENVGISTMTVDEQFFQTLEIEWLTKPENIHDLATKHQLLLNESGIEKLKISGNPVGVHLEVEEGRSEIAGIVKDFNFVSLQSPVEGMLFKVVADTTVVAHQGGQFYLRLQPNSDLQGQLAQIGQVFRQFDAEMPFEHYFLDEAFDKQHRAELRMGYLFSGFTAVAVVLACLGLLGLATFSAEKRVKEIGVRKVLGASVWNITGLLTTDFLKLVTLAIVIAVPISWYAMQQWLEGFAYRIEPGAGLFIAAGVATVCIAIFTTGFQSIRAALADPVKALRNE